MSLFQEENISKENTWTHDYAQQLMHPDHKGSSSIALVCQSLIASLSKLRMLWQAKLMPRQVAKRPQQIVSITGQDRKDMTRLNLQLLPKCLATWSA